MQRTWHGDHNRKNMIWFREVSWIVVHFPFEKWKIKIILSQNVDLGMLIRDTATATLRYWNVWIGIVKPVPEPLSFHHSLNPFPFITLWTPFLSSLPEPLFFHHSLNPFSFITPWTPYLSSLTTGAQPLHAGKYKIPAD